MIVRSNNRVVSAPKGWNGRKARSTGTHPLTPKKVSHVKIPARALRKPIKLAAPEEKSTGDDLRLNPIPKTGRRSAPRLRLNLPAKLVGVNRVYPCVLLNVSRSGAQVAIPEELPVGEGGMLRCAKINDFVVVARSEQGFNALEFDEEISNDLVLDVRHYYDNFDGSERREIASMVRRWVDGEIDDDRPYIA